MEFNVVRKRETIPAVCRYFSQVKEIAIDTETNNQLNPREGFLRLIQISDGIKTVVIDLKECFPLYWEGEDIKDKEEILLLKELLENPKILKVLHNAVFDYEWIMYHLGIRMVNVADTMLASQIVDNLEQKHGLAYVSKRKLNLDLDKTEQNTNWCGILSPEKFEYAAMDVYYLLKLWHILLQDLLDFGLVDTSKLEFSLIEPMADLKHDGIHANKELYETKIHLIEELQVIANKKLQEALVEEDKPVVVQQSLFGEIPEKVKGGVLVSSPAQIKKVLQKKGIPIIDKDWWEVQELYQSLATNSSKEQAKIEMQNCVDMVKRRYLRQGKYFADGTGAKTLSPITEEYEILQLLKDSREADKMSTSYGREFLKHIKEVEGDTRIFASYRQIGAPTGRMACREPNIQNITNKPIVIGGEEFEIGLREAFDYPKGKKGVNCLTEDTLIATQRGLIPIKNVVETDKVAQEDGSFCQVLRKIPQGLKPVYTITLENGQVLEATKEHRIRVIDEKGNYIWKEVRHLTAYDYACLSPMKTIGNYQVLPELEFSHFNEKKSVKTPKFLDEDVAELLGYFVGDGSFKTSNVSFVVNENDVELYEYLKEKTVKMFNLDKFFETSYRGVKEFKFSSKSVSLWLQKVCSKECLTEYILQSPDSVKAAFLRGYFESDGSISNSVICIGSSRKRIIEDVKNLLSSIGINSCFCQKKNLLNKKTFYGYVVSFSGKNAEKFGNTVGFLSARKKEKLLHLKKGINHSEGFPNLRNKVKEIKSDYVVLKNVRNRDSRVSKELASLLSKKTVEELGLHFLLNNNQIYKRIKSVQFSGEKCVFDLTVEKTSSYIANSFINHNCDYSQIELRVLADMSGDPVMIETFKKDKDLHSVAGAKHLRMDYDEFEKRIKDKHHPDHEKCVKARHFAKRVNFGTVYGIGAKGLSVQLKCSEAEAQKWIDGFAATFSIAWEFLQKQAKLAINNLMAKTVLGRRQLFQKPEEKWQIGRIGRNGMNMPIQGTAADIMKRAFYLLHKSLKPYNAKIVSIVHDEVTVECDADIADIVAGLVEKALIDAAEETLKHVPVKVDAHVIANWGNK